ncbi:putative TULIP family P47-like protein [Seiridium cardinale]|uniref:TULIP family P47-like protein n=1 Tax=Seiridium cardinale TaxID=138064 RepID=A0ABR2Y589_9PEZI
MTPITTNMSMNGWDVVSVVTIPFVNAAIHTQGGSPTKMEVSNGTINAQAGFGTWQITVGGGSNLLMFNIPLTNMTGTVTKDGKIIAQFNYPSLAAKLELVLTFVDSSATDRKLVVDSKTPPTAILSLTDDKGQNLSNALDDTFIKQALTVWCGANLSQFSHVFASVNLEPSTSTDEKWAFCKPSTVAYTYIAGNSLTNSYLGITYNTAGKTTPGSVAQIDPTFIPAGCQAAFMLSPALFVTNFLAPAARQQFGIPASSLKIDTTLSNIELTAGTKVALPNVAAGKSDTTSTIVTAVIRGILGGLFEGAADVIMPMPKREYHPFLEEFSITVENSIVTTYAKTSTVVVEEAYGTVTALNNSKSWITLSLDPKTQTPKYTNTQPSVNSHTIQESQGFRIVQGVLQAIGIVALAIGAVITDGLELVVIGALAGVLEGGQQYVLADIESKHKDVAPEINNLVNNLSLPVQWAGKGPFRVAQAGLYRGGFFLAGTLTVAL